MATRSTMRLGMALDKHHPCPSRVKTCSCVHHIDPCAFKHVYAVDAPLVMTVQRRCSAAPWQTTIRESMSLWTILATPATSILRHFR